MSLDRLAELAQTVLAGQVSPSLLEHLRRASHGDPRRAVTTLRRWSALGSIVWTSSGLELVTDDSGWDEQPRLSRTVHEMQRHMSPVQAELLQAIAILDRPVTAAELMLLAATRFGLTDTDHMDGAELQALLDQLIDVGALSNTPQGYQLRTLRLRDDTLTWMRPSARRRLHSRLVECNLATEVTLRST